MIKIDKLSFLFFILVVLIFTGMIACRIIIEYNHFDDYCDNYCGAGNWTLNETTDIENNRFYVGEIWECVCK
jgi:hypothetical protein